MKAPRRCWSSPGFLLENFLGTVFHTNWTVKSSNLLNRLNARRFLRRPKLYDGHKLWPFYGVLWSIFDEEEPGSGWMFLRCLFNLEILRNENTQKWKLQQEETSKFVAGNLRHSIYVAYNLWQFSLKMLTRRLNTKGLTSQTCGCWASKNFKRKL